MQHDHKVALHLHEVTRHWVSMNSLSLHAPTSPVSGPSGLRQFAVCLVDWLLENSVAEHHTSSAWPLMMQSCLASGF